MSAVNEGILELKTKTERLADCFYQQKSQEGYQVLVLIIDDLSALSVILEGNRENTAIAELYTELSEKLQEVMTAMVEKDTVLIADIMRYDMIDILDQITAFEL